MSTTPRYVPSPGEMVFVSIRCIQARYLLRPSKRVNKLILGVLAKAQKKYEVRVFAPAFLSNHGHMLLWFRDAEQQAKFMHFVDGNIAREVGRLHGWKGKFWDGPFASTIVANDEASQVKMLRYLLEQGCKEGLVARPQDWPGVHAASILLSARNPKGIWVDRTGLYEARRRKGNQGKVRPLDFEEELELKLSPLPCWEHLSEQEYLERISEIVQEIEEKTAARHREEESRPLGRGAVLRQNPRFEPDEPKQGPLPLVHAATREMRRRYLEALAIFLRAYREASSRFRSGEKGVQFPHGCFPPAGPFLRAHGPPAT